MISCNVSPVPTGGAIMLDLTNGNGAPTATTSLLVERAVAGSTTFVTLFNGLPADCMLLLDVNEGAPDGQPGPLQPGVSYVYRLTDSLGSITTPAAACPTAITVVPNSETALLIRLLEAAVKGVMLPNGITKRPVVLSAMPLTLLPPLPIISVNQDLLQQEDVPIGQDAMKLNGDLTRTIGGHARFVWRVSVLSAAPGERDFWKDAVLAIFNVLVATVFDPIGKNISHRYQANCYQVQKESSGAMPGFYGADMMLELQGVFNTTIQVYFGEIEHINAAFVFPDGASQQIVMPLSG